MFSFRSPDIWVSTSDTNTQNPHPSKRAPILHLRNPYKNKKRLAETLISAINIHSVTQQRGAFSPTALVPILPVIERASLGSASDEAESVSNL